MCICRGLEIKWNINISQHYPTFYCALHILQLFTRRPIQQNLYFCTQNKEIFLNHTYVETHLA